MRGNKHVGKGEQTRQFVLLQDLMGKVCKENAFIFFVDIQHNATDMSAFQSLDEGLDMNKAPSADVDEHDSGRFQTRGALSDFGRGPFARPACALCHLLYRDGLHL